MIPYFETSTGLEMKLEDMSLISSLSPTSGTPCSDGGLIYKVMVLKFDSWIRLMQECRFSTKSKYLELHSSDCFVVAIVDVLGVGTKLPCARGRDGLVVPLGDQVGLAELLALLVCLLTPRACHDIIGHIGLGAEVQW